MMIGSCRGICGSLLKCIFLRTKTERNFIAHRVGTSAQGTGTNAYPIGGYAQDVSDRVLNYSGQGGQNGVE